MYRPALFLALITLTCSADQPIPLSGLILDLDASKGLTMEDGDKVSSWRSELPDLPPKDFVKRDEGRKAPGSGRPELRKSIPELKGKPALVFRRQELCCLDEDYFDSLTTGSGNTWIAILAPHVQHAGLANVNSFFGNLRNGEKFEGLWACFNDDNTVWFGARNGITFGRFDANNPQVVGPKLETGKFHLIAGRMASGEGSIPLELFVTNPSPVATSDVPVNPAANPSRMAIGQERDATQHPGHESFDGEIARFLIWNRPLSDKELTRTFAALKTSYGLK
jgi:hypothetical protein